MANGMLGSKKKILMLSISLGMLLAITIYDFARGKLYDYGWRSKAFVIFMVIYLLWNLADEVNKVLKRRQMDK